MSDFVQVLRLDSQFRNGGSGSDFEIELADNLSCGPNTVCVVNAVSFPMTVYTIEQGVNDRLYVRSSIPSIRLLQTDTVIITEGQYDGPRFATELALKLNSLHGQGAPTWDVQYDTTENCFIIAWGPGVVWERSWQIMSEAQMKTVVWNGYVDRSNLRSCNNVLRLEAEPQAVSNGEEYRTGFFDNMADHHVVYLHSNLTSFKSSGPRQADRDVICRIPVDVGYGYMNHWRSYGGSNEYFPVPNSQLKTIRFWLTNAKGDILDLHGGTISIELFFFDIAT